MPIMEKKIFIEERTNKAFALIFKENVKVFDLNEKKNAKYAKLYISCAHYDLKKLLEIVLGVS